MTLALAQLGEVEPAQVLGENTLQRARQAFDPNHPITLYLTQAASSGLLGDDAAADRWSQPL